MQDTNSVKDSVLDSWLFEDEITEAVSDSTPESEAEEQEPIKVERQRPPFTMVRKSLLEDDSLTGPQKMVYVALCYFADYDTGKLTVKRKTISDIAGCSVSTVDRSLDELESRGYIAIQHRKSQGKYYLSSTYTLLDFWTDNAPIPPDKPSKKQPETDMPTENTDNPGGFTETPPDNIDILGASQRIEGGFTEKTFLNESVLNKKEEEGGTNSGRTTPSRGEPESDTQPPPISKNMNEPGSRPIRDLISYHAITVDNNMKRRLTEFNRDYGSEALTRLINEGMSDGIKPDFFNTDFIPYLNRRPPPVLSDPPKCADCNGERPPGTLIDWDGSRICTECAKKRRDADQARNELVAVS